MNAEGDKAHLLLHPPLPCNNPEPPLIPGGVTNSNLLKGSILPGSL